MEIQSEEVPHQQHRGNALLGLLEQVLQVQQDALPLVLVDEGGGDAGLAGAPRAPDPVHVVLDLVGEVVVDHVLDVGEVQALAGHVCGHQHVLLAALQCHTC